MASYMCIGKAENDQVVIGDIKGDAKTRLHTDWIVIESFDLGLDFSKLLSEWSGSQDRAKQAADKAAEAKKPASKDQKAGKEKKEEGIKANTLKLSKASDFSSTKLMKWATVGTPLDVQLHCCQDIDDYFYDLIFRGVVLTNFSLDDGSSETLQFEWDALVLCWWTFDEHNQWVKGVPAEFKKTDFTESRAPVVAASAAAAGGAEPKSGALLPPAPPGSHSLDLDLLTAASGLRLGLPPPPAEPERLEAQQRLLKIPKVGGIEFQLDSFYGQECVSGLFHYRLVLRSDTLDIEPSKVVGQSISWQLEDEEDKSEHKRPKRHFHGIVSDFTWAEMAGDVQRRYWATVVPALWRLTKRSNSRVWQEKTVLQVVEDVFEKAQLEDYDVQNVKKDHPALTFCVQYQETDFDFVSRLLEEAGLFYFFRQEEDKHVLVLSDSTTAYVEGEEHTLRYALHQHREPRVTFWRHHYTLISGKHDSRDYSYLNAQEPLKASASTQVDLPGVQELELYEYPGKYEDNAQATPVADLRLQQQEILHHVVDAACGYDSLAVGSIISLANPPGEEEGGPAASKTYAVIQVEHESDQVPTALSNVVSYRCRFRCIPDDVAYVPQRDTPKPRIPGPQTAVVVGDKETDDDLVDTDDLGRIKVQFHWDRLGEKNTDSSCWIRVAQSIAGPGWGSVVLPRLGQEVVVSFLEGDPDRPLITGVVYNNLHTPYHALPDAKYKTVFMTRSFPDGGKENFNELTFHDEKDKEEIYLHAERDFKRVVEHDDILEIGEKETGGQTITIEGDQTTTIKQGNREATLDSGNDTLTVSSGSHKIDVSAGKSELSAAQSIELKVGGNSVKIDTSSITLTVGGASVKVEMTGVTLKGMMIKGEADVQAEIKGLMTSIKGDAMLTTKGGITMMS